MTGTRVILLGHGSRLAEANRALFAVAERLSAELELDVGAAFLQLAEPTLGTAVGEAVGAGAGEVVILPFFLFPGVHIQQDLPDLVEELRTRHPGLRIATAGCLGDHPMVTLAAAERVREVMP